MLMIHLHDVVTTVGATPLLASTTVVTPALAHSQSSSQSQPTVPIPAVSSPTPATAVLMLMGCALARYQSFLHVGAEYLFTGSAVMGNCCVFKDVFVFGLRMITVVFFSLFSCCSFALLHAHCSRFVGSI
jgi:hypothetical protein